MNNLKQEISAGQKWKPANHRCHENNDTQLKQSRYPDNHTTVLHSTATCLTRLTHHLTFCSRFPGEPGLSSSPWCSSYTCSRKEPLGITGNGRGFSPGQMPFCHPTSSVNALTPTSEDHPLARSFLHAPLHSFYASFLKQL